MSFGRALEPNVISVSRSMVWLLVRDLLALHEKCEPKKEIGVPQAFV